MIFRLANRHTQWGPYNGLAGWSYSDTYRHPSPGDDNLHNFTKKHRFGFQSLELARRWWFRLSDLQLWHEEHDMRLFVFARTPDLDVKEGRNQCAFKPSDNPLILPAFAIHTMDEPTIAALLKDHLS